MPANFEIHIFGICLCFYKGGAWNVIFPCDTHHPVHFNSNGSGTDLGQMGRMVRVDFPKDSIGGGVAPQYGSTSTAPTFNMSAAYAHGNAGGAANLTLKNLNAPDPTTGKPYDFVWLTIPNSTLNSRNAGVCPYYVQDVSAVGLPPDVLDDLVAREVVIEFTLIKPMVLEARDERDATYTPAVGSPFALPTGKHIVEIDNDCHTGCPKENDFLHLYRIVEDGQKRQFAAGQLKCKAGKEQTKKPRRHADCWPAEEKRDGIMKGFSTAYGNCDPVESNPPPGP